MCYSGTVQTRMRITKYGHCCLLIETGDLRLLTDPGNYNQVPEVDNLDYVIITHEHQDHCHVDAVKSVLRQNRAAHVITHAGVGRILQEAGVAFMDIRDGEEKILKGVSVRSFGTEHACIHPDLPPVQNTGFLIDGRLFYPGDAFHDPRVPVEILALPVAGPWMKLSEAVEYAKALKPSVVFPVHDGMLRQEHQLRPTRAIPESLLAPLGIRFQDLREGDMIEL